MAAVRSCSPEVEPLAASWWWSADTVAVVTGANKGIGFALVRQLAKLGLTVILTARDVKKGHAASTALRQSGLPVDFHQLDVSDDSSIQEFASWLKCAYGSLDILVNNAAVSYNEINQNSVDQAESVIKTNFYGPKLLTEALLPLFRRSPSTSRILNISSRLGTLNKVKNPRIKALLLDEERLSEARIEWMVKQFVDQVKKGVWEEEGWPEVWTEYAVSKLALNAYTRLMARQHRGRGLSVNCYCPGFTRTAMTGGQGKYTPDDAARLAAQIVLLSPEELPTGKFFVGTTPLLYSRL